jgi:hypothetical protein
MRLLLAAAASAIMLIGTLPSPVFAGSGTPQEQAARQYCWQKLGLSASQSVGGTQLKAIEACVTTRLGRPDPYFAAQPAQGASAATVADDRFQATCKPKSSATSAAMTIHCTRTDKAFFDVTFNSTNANFELFRKLAASKGVALCDFYLPPPAQAAQGTMSCRDKSDKVDQAKPSDPNANNGGAAPQAVGTSDTNSGCIDAGLGVPELRCTVSVGDTVQMVDGAIPVRLLSIAGKVATMSISGRPEPFHLAAGNLEGFTPPQLGATYCLRIAVVNSPQQNVVYLFWKGPTPTSC